MEKRQKIRRVVGMFQNGKGFIAVEYASGKVQISEWKNKKALATTTDKSANRNKNQKSN